MTCRPLAELAVGTALESIAATVTRTPSALMVLRIPRVTVGIVMSAPRQLMVPLAVVLVASAPAELKSSPAIYCVAAEFIFKAAVVILIAHSGGAGRGGGDGTAGDQQATGGNRRSSSDGAHHHIQTVVLANSPEVLMKVPIATFRP